ncbi:SULT1B1 [Cordylochernes scorpioides]|uniref:SULT1B1 n=1 Tax=Cordylochernes scorpioides TaxID=51811 RepID=A0ABY6KKJ8_9ARAC|nr:SULT1B1 [Cordylochernes scorpioides]
MWNQGKPCKSFNEFKECASFLDLEGVRNLEDLKAPRMIMTHIPYEKCPKKEETKYIYVFRNPKDVIVSYYYFLNGILEKPLDLDSASELFLDGKLIYGDYFKDVKLWYEHRDDPNVLLVVYEEMKEDLEKSVMTIAKFLNIEEALKENPEIMKKIIKYSSVEETKRVLEADTSLIDKAKGDILKPEMIPKTAKISFVRKGIVGDWKTHLSREQEERLNERTEKEFAGIDFYEPKLARIFGKVQLLSALSYKPETSDIFITCYPKSGLNWTQYIVYLILNKGNPCKSIEEFTKASVFIDKYGADSLKSLSYPTMIKTHIPFSKHSISKEAKYIYIARNPKDVAVSYYHYLNKRLESPIDLMIS